MDAILLEMELVFTSNTLNTLTIQPGHYMGCQIRRGVSWQVEYHPGMVNSLYLTCPNAVAVCLTSISLDSPNCSINSQLLGVNCTTQPLFINILWLRSQQSGKPLTPTAHPGTTIHCIPNITSHHPSHLHHLLAF